MKAIGMPAKRYDWVHLTHCSEIPSWDLNQCINYFALSECTQIKLPGDGTAAQKKEMVLKRLTKLIADKQKPKSSNEHRQPPQQQQRHQSQQQEEQIDLTVVAFVFNLLQWLLDRALLGVKMPQVIISADNSKENLQCDIQRLYQNTLLLIQTINQPSNKSTGAAVQIHMRNRPLLVPRTG
jgi:hypothetical protein